MLIVKQLFFTSLLHQAKSFKTTVIELASIIYLAPIPKSTGVVILVETEVPSRLTTGACDATR